MEADIGVKGAAVEEGVIEEVVGAAMEGGGVVGEAMMRGMIMGGKSAGHAPEGYPDPGMFLLYYLKYNYEF